MLDAPLALIAEITHRCPLHCVYCSNPLQMVSPTSELTTREWETVFEQGAKMGMLHVHLSGGEPLARGDLTQMVSFAHRCGLYTNLITSGIGWSERRWDELVVAGLDHIQLSFQDSREASANRIAGARAHTLKLGIASMIRGSQVAFTVNMVVHRHNVDHLKEMIALAESLQPERLEIAHVQYYGWAWKNVDALLTHPGTGARIFGNNRCRPETTHGTNSHPCSRARLLCPISESLHGRMGTPSTAGRPKRQGSSLSRRSRYSRVTIRKRP